MSDFRTGLARAPQASEGAQPGTSNPRTLPTGRVSASDAEPSTSRVRWQPQGPILLLLRPRKLCFIDGQPMFGLTNGDRQNKTGHLVPDPMSDHKAIDGSVILEEERDGLVSLWSDGSNIGPKHQPAFGIEVPRFRRDALGAGNNDICVFLADLFNSLQFHFGKQFF